MLDIKKIAGIMAISGLLLPSAIFGAQVVGGFGTEPRSVRAAASDVPPAKQFGVHIGNDITPAHIEAQLGAKVDMVAWFENWQRPSISKNKLQHACDNGYTPLISWESWHGGDGEQNPYPLADIAAGKYDYKIAHFLHEVQKVCGDKEVIVRFNHEMEMRPNYGYAWYPWQGQPAEYVAAWQRVVNMARDKDSHISWLWSPNRADEHTTAYYPGAQYVDYVGLTLNHPPEITGKYATFADFYLPNQAALEAYHKPIIIGETAYTGPTDAARLQWVQSMFAHFAADTRMQAIVWLDRELNHVDYRLSTTPEVYPLIQQQLTQLRSK